MSEWRLVANFGGMAVPIVHEVTEYAATPYGGDGVSNYLYIRVNNQDCYGINNVCQAIGEGWSSDIAEQYYNRGYQYDLSAGNPTVNFGDAGAFVINFSQQGTSTYQWSVTNVFRSSRVGAGSIWYGDDRNVWRYYTPSFVGFIFYTASGDKLLCIYSTRRYMDIAREIVYHGYNDSRTIINLSYIEREYNYTFDFDLFSPNFGVPSEPDGYGQGTGMPTFDNSSDTIAIPDMPDIGISSAGFVNVYHVTQGQLQNLGSKIFPDITLPTSAPADIQEALEALYSVSQFVINSFQNSKLIDYVIDCHIIPVAPSDGASASIHVGYKDTEISAPRVSSDYVDFDCGSISIGEYYANYIDYLTRARLFLPFVGFIDLKPEFWQSGTINVRYRFNVIDGSFMAYVKSTSSKSQLSDTVIGQYGGNSCVHIPLTGLNYSSFISGLVTGSMSLAASAQSGNVAGAVDSALSMLNNKPSVAQSNNYNSSTSFLGVRRPYLMIERPVASFSQEYTRDHGLPLNVTMALSSITGYTVIDNIDLIGFDEATSEECAEIKSLLQNGVIF